MHPETEMSQSGLEPGLPRWEASTVIYQRARVPVASQLIT
jgi:hypothetical protein